MNRYRKLVRFGFSVCLMVLFQNRVAKGHDGCALPADLHEQVARRYPAAAVVTLADLHEDDRKFFEADHGKECPGLVRVDFYGDGKPTWALVLISRDRFHGSESQLVIARRLGSGWEIRLLDTGGAPVPVVWKQDPGKYVDVYGNKEIQANNPVIVFCRYESWAILYSWTGKHVQKIWIAD